MEKTIEYNHSSIYYRVAGRGEPVILLHGFAEDGSIWDQQVLHLQENNLLIIPDLPGSGHSDITGDVSMEGMADVVKAIADAENIFRPVMIGHSMGGYVTLAFAERYPETLSAFGLFHSTTYADTPEKIASRKKNIGFISSHGTHKFLSQSIPGLFSDEFKTRHPDVIEKLITQYRLFKPTFLILYYEAMMKRPDRTHVLKTFVKPVLFVIGKFDNAIPFGDSLQLCHLPSLSYIHILGNSGHMGMIEEVNSSNEILQSFLKSIPDFTNSPTQQI